MIRSRMNGTVHDGTGFGVQIRSCQPKEATVIGILPQITGAMDDRYQYNDAGDRTGASMEELETVASEVGKTAPRPLMRCR